MRSDAHNEIVPKHIRPTAPAINATSAQRKSYPSPTPRTPTKRAARRYPDGVQYEDRASLPQESICQTMGGVVLAG